jgi:hypothetical protein
MKTPLDIGYYNCSDESPYQKHGKANTRNLRAFPGSLERLSSLRITAKSAQLRKNPNIA